MKQQISVDGETRIFPIIGHPIGQVKSPASLSQIMADRGFNGLVVPLHILPEDLSGWLAQAKAMRNVNGIVITVPHKVPCLAFCARASDRAKASGAVNIMIREDDHWIGDATDGHGYMDGIAAEGFDVAGKPALLVGAGGAGSAIAYEILARGASELALHDIDVQRRDALLARLNQAFPGKARAGSTDPRGFALVANATPLGMREGDPLPVQVEHLSADQFVADVVTRPAVPPLIAAARAKGCGTMPGSGMFDAQAVLLAELLMGNRKIVA
ncbi:MULTISPECIES: shikimate dehydrogenase family protein [Alphaproteobacteria]|uniref:Shikimate dehydrogenase n=2 Tax=Alphaproteobacteria TaxID=28211 RepID=A0A512HH87_9HYPH|nr:MULTISPECIES: shikimate dehydrogenase [Alphaproteobacteria]GEO84815.1 shikimate dehydrogenase [Ciceribacter naphthalenivorans]GLR20564.1 shikimate dehydrogenase [Ciceribacter naphthalenivorans]GLT03420.1 shikimate dehydrogenase [Sphingomonas psychrolutea]